MGPCGILALLAIIVFSLGCGEGANQETRDAYLFTLLDAGQLPRNRADLRVPEDASAPIRDASVARDMNPPDLNPVDARTPADEGVTQDVLPMAPDEGASAAEDPLTEIGTDTDGDGLDDGWEQGAGDISILDWQSSDTNGDGTPDGHEDFDNDGLTALQEQGAGRLNSLTASHRPHPFKLDILVELDAMDGKMVGPDVLETVVSAYAALNLSGTSGHRGVSIHFYGDQLHLPVEVFDDDFEPRQRLLMGSGPIFEGAPDGFPFSQLIHVVLGSRRRDLDTRGGEVITHAQDIERTGVLVYVDTIGDVFPRCGLEDPPPIPFITVGEAIASTLVHEIGHTLQLGHDTNVGGGINAWNIMSVPQGCVDTRRRAHGEGNRDPSLGNTEDVSGPRFSTAAADLMNLTNKLSVDTSELVDNDDGQEM